MIDKPYLDKWGLPVTRDGDGGDSCATAGTLAALRAPSPRILRIAYLPKHAEPLRHPDSTQWYGRPKRFSRDQLISFICGLIIQENPWLLKRLFKQHAKRGFLTAWNTMRNFVYETEEEHKLKSTPDVPWDPSWKFPDPTLFEVWGLWIRAMHAWYLYPLLFIFDLETLGGALTWRWIRTDRVCRNHLLVLHVTRYRYPTPVSWLARKVTPVDDLIQRWSEHCQDTGEYDSSSHFKEAFK